MKINIVSVGKIKDKNLKELVDYYKKLSSKYADVKIVNIKDENKKLTEDDVNKLSAKFSNLFVLTEHGKEYTTERFAEFIRKYETTGTVISFLIAGSEGVNFKPNNSLSLGKMTFPHELSQVLLLEQLFRVMNLNRGGKYHR